MPTEVVSRIQIQTSLQGEAETTAGLNRVAGAQKAVGVSADVAAQKTTAYEQAMLKQQRTIDIMLQQNRQLAAANDNVSKSFTETGLQVAEAANHLRVAGEVAYAFSPAFRGVVNGLAGPALSAASTALIAVSAGIVTATNVMGRGLIVVGEAAARSSAALVPFGAGLASVGASMAAFSPAVATVATSIASRLIPPLLLFTRIAGPILLVVDAFRAMAAITELGAEKIKEFSDLASNASTAGVSTDFFQRQALGAKAFGVEADLATEALKKFKEVSQPTLDGSAFDQRLDALVKAGNFVNNTGVAAYRNATDAETKYRAVVDIITQAGAAGERLAAIDLASKFASPELLAMLRADYAVLQEMQAASDAVKPAEIVSSEQIGYALQLKTRLADANEIITNGLKPVQKDLTQLGLNYQESWVAIVELEATAVSSLNAMYGWVKGIGDVFTTIGNLSFWTKLTQLTGALGLNSSPEGLTLPNQPSFNTGAGSTTNAALAAGLANAKAIQAAMQQASDVETKVLGDNSQKIVKSETEANDAVDRAINTLRRHVEEQKADTLAVGLGDGALAAFRAQAAQTSAIQANGGKITAEQSAKFAQLTIDAQNAADALAKAKVAYEISFGRQTALLSPEDVHIAQQLKAIYPDVATALNSVEAQGLRTNQALSALSSQVSGQLVTGLSDIADGTKSASQGFADMGKVIARAIEEMVVKLYIVIPLMRALQSLVSGFGGGGGSSEANALASGIAPLARGQAFGPNVIPFAQGSVFANRVFDGPTLFKFASGGGVGSGVMGEAGPEAVVPLRRGADGKLGIQSAGGGSNVAVNVNVQHDASQSKVSVQQSKNNSGGVDLQIMVEQIEGQIAGNVSDGRGSLHSAMTSKFGLTPKFA